MSGLGNRYYPPIGMVNPLGGGLMEGWHYIVYRNDEGQATFAECDRANAITRFEPIPADLEIFPIPDGVPDGFIGQVAPMVYRLKDGRSLLGSEEHLISLFRDILRREPDQIAAGDVLQIAELCGDAELIEAAARQAAAVMADRGLRPLQHWRETVIAAAVQKAMIAARPDLIDLCSTLPVTMRLLLDGGDAWFVIPGALYRAIGAQEIDTPGADAILRGLGCARRGFIDGWREPLPFLEV